MWPTLFQHLCLSFGLFATGFTGHAGEVCRSSTKASQTVLTRAVAHAIQPDSTWEATWQLEVVSEISLWHLKFSIWRRIQTMSVKNRWFRIATQFPQRCNQQNSHHHQGITSLTQSPSRRSSNSGDPFAKSISSKPTWARNQHIRCLKTLKTPWIL